MIFKEDIGGVSTRIGKSKNGNSLFIQYGQKGVVQVDILDIKNPQVKFLSALIGENYTDSI